MKQRLPWILTLLLSAIGIAAVVRRSVVLIAGQDSQSFDSAFGRHKVLTFFHMIPGVVFVILGPLQFSKTLRARRPVLHHWSGRIFVAASLIIGVTALIMSPLMAIGGVNEAAATILFALLFLFAVLKGYAAARRRQFVRHREWMIRAFAIGLAIAFIRPIIGIFFATSGLTHLTPQQFFGTAFWLGFTIQTIAAEVWINYTRLSVTALRANL